MTQKPRIDEKKPLNQNWLRDNNYQGASTKHSVAPMKGSTSYFYIKINNAAYKYKLYNNKLLQQ
ncbi:MAG: hypothetical protein MGG11_15305 [Trichodesmium sp. MAG_R03]|nr:hypothetical protein [Trichodesmium sp. MAG_R03]